LTYHLRLEQPAAVTSQQCYEIENLRFERDELATAPQLSIAMVEREVAEAEQGHRPQR
jgi:hypothetical protein